MAICQALDELSVTDKNLLLLTDSYSVLQALKCLTIKSPKVIHRLAGKILVRKKFNQKICLVWTPGHSPIHWNEKADLLAKAVTESHFTYCCVWGLVHAKSYVVVKHPPVGVAWKFEGGYHLRYVLVII
ncbi:hypothetical protein AVEN_210447-1 [Araneus ventricosus]|uniref:RNase H type-1 domain-containing protein n=1 Tax=Araneus ventricosus TaxID=182803 RepID=A0A4Y2HW81_ARAVE|nr:hypothetical protein AVEN_210447-1 [Araneus ventricosus]